MVTSTVKRREYAKKRELAAQRLAYREAIVKAVLDIFSYIWDWVESRKIDKHVVTAFTLYYMVYLIMWAERFASANSGKSGLEVAAIIAAVHAPYMALQTFVLRFYFNDRPKYIVRDEPEIE